MLRSLRQCDAFDVALACVMVACKVGGIPKRLGVLLPLWQRVRKGDIASDGGISSMSADKYEALEASALLYERHLLATLCFDIWPSNPYKLFDMCYRLLPTHGRGNNGGDVGQAGGAGVNSSSAVAAASTTSPATKSNAAGRNRRWSVRSAGCTSTNSQLSGSVHPGDNLLL